MAAEPVPSDLPSELLSKQGRLQRNAETRVGPSWLAANQEGIALFHFVFLGAACSTPGLCRRKGSRGGKFGPTGDRQLKDRAQGQWRPYLTGPW